MKYQLVLCDIDGTLLSDDSILFTTTENTIRDLVEAGVLFATVSARTISSADRAISPILGMCCANAYVNGAFAQTQSGEVLVDRPIEDWEATILIEQLNKVNASFCYIYKDGAMALIRHSESNWGFNQHHGSFQKVSVFDRPPEEEAYLISVEAEDTQSVIEFVHDVLPGVSASPIVKTPSGLGVSFFQKKGSDKEAALLGIAAHYGVDFSNVLAVGDSMINDGPMIEAAGCGVAMKNAHHGLYEKAEYITKKDNNEDGVGEFLRDLFGL